MTPDEEFVADLLSMDDSELGILWCNPKWIEKYVVLSTDGISTFFTTCGLISSLLFRHTSIVPESMYLVLDQPTPNHKNLIIRSSRYLEIRDNVSKMIEL